MNGEPFPTRTSPCVTEGCTGTTIERGERCHICTLGEADMWAVVIDVLEEVERILASVGGDR